MGEKILISRPQIMGKSFEMIINSIKEAQKGKVIMYAHPDGNVAILDYKEYDRLKKLDKSK